MSKDAACGVDGIWYLEHIPIFDGGLLHKKITQIIAYVIASERGSNFNQVEKERAGAVVHIQNHFQLKKHDSADIKKQEDYFLAGAHRWIHGSSGQQGDERQLRLDELNHCAYYSLCLCHAYVHSKASLICMQASVPYQEGFWVGDFFPIAKYQGGDASFIS